MSEKVPIVFSRRYDITLCGIEKLHPFDSAKYGKVYKHLRKQLGLKKSQFHTPKIVTEEELEIIHTPEYLHSLKNSRNVAAVTELLFLSAIPNFLLQSRLLKPMKYATGGTILGCELACEHGWAINLSGGYHHAKAGGGEGFCFFADISIAIHKLWQQHPEHKVLVIDLDAHQGNGIEATLQNDPRIRICDVYNKGIYPNDVKAKKYIDFDYPVAPYIKDKEYLSTVQQGLEKCSEFKADLIIYNAGTDIYHKDPLGAMSISKEGIIERDDMIFSYARDNKTPVLMVLSGGYSKESADIIGASLVAGWTKYLK